MKKGHAGFTLVELMVVMVILGLLSGLLVVKVLPALEVTKVKTTRLKIAKISTAIDRFLLDSGSRPETLEALVTRPDVEMWMGPYLEADEIVDEWGNPIHYLAQGRVKEFDLLSYGKDGVPGGQDANADISN